MRVTLLLKTCPHVYMLCLTVARPKGYLRRLPWPRNSQPRSRRTVDPYFHGSLRRNCFDDCPNREACFGSLREEVAVSHASDISRSHRSNVALRLSPPDTLFQEGNCMHAVPWPKLSQLTDDSRHLAHGHHTSRPPAIMPTPIAALAPCAARG